MSKLAVIFSGVGYTKDRPLLYYAGKIATSYGYDLAVVDFSGIKWTKEELKDHRRFAEILGECMKKAESVLAERDLDSIEHILFISKSIGTVVAAAYAKKCSLAVRQVFFTPLEAFGSFLEEDNGLVFYGNADPFANYEAVEEICRKYKLESHCIEQANHSLETEDVLANLDNLKQVMKQVDDRIADRSIYRYKVPAMDGSISSLEEYRGKVLLIVNTATGCGFTPQYEALENMYRKYHREGFEILDFPCNQFGKQAPGTVSDIHSFCTARYDISFPQFNKIEVNGANELELYTYLKSKQGFHGFGDSLDASFLKKKLEKEMPGYENTSDIKWNFTKFLVSRSGEVLARFEASESMELVEEAVQRAIGI